MKLVELFETKIQLNELKEYLDLNYYGSWIHPDGTVDGVNNHTDWLKDNYGPEHRFNWGMAFDNGWVRIAHKHISLDIQGNLDDIVKTFKYWWPTAIKSDTVFVDVVKIVDNIRTEYSMSKTYKIPKDKVKLRQDFGPQQKTITEEKIVQAAFKDPATGKIYPTGQVHDMEVVMKEFGFDPNNEDDWEGFIKIYNTLTDGFITDKGRFFDRQEAARLVGSPEEKLSTELVKGMGPNPHWQRRGVDPEIKN